MTERIRNGRRAVEWENEWWMRRVKDEESQLCAGSHVGERSSARVRVKEGECEGE